MMRLLHAKSGLYHHQPKKKRGLRRTIAAVGVVLVLVISLSGLLYSLPVNAVNAQAVHPSISTGDQIAFDWPAAKQSAVGAVDYGVLVASQNQKPLPIASTTKMFTALMVLKAKPINESEAGPDITFTDEDVAIADAYVQKLGVIYPVKAGQVMSEQDALKVMLIISANNFADKLAIWAYGSVDAYTQAANQYLPTVGLHNTHIADASGFSPQTVSTADDLVLAAQLLLKDPVLAQIVGTQSATVGGTRLQNTNKLLNQDEVIGIKTGNTDEAGGCFVIARKIIIDGEHEITVLAAVMGAKDVAAAMAAAKELTIQSQTGFETETLIAKGTKVASYQAPWGQVVDAVTDSDITSVVWKGTEFEITVDAEPVSIDTTQGQSVGSATVKSDPHNITTTIVLENSLSKPSWQWRMYQRYVDKLQAKT